MTLRIITAVHDGKLQTHSEQVWAKIKNCTVKFLQQRRRAGYNDNEIINLPYGKSPNRMTILEKNQTALYPLWRQFCFCGKGQETYTKKGICN